MLNYAGVCMAETKGLSKPPPTRRVRLPLLTMPPYDKSNIFHRAQIQPHPCKPMIPLAFNSPTRRSSTMYKVPVL